MYSSHPAQSHPIPMVFFDVVVARADTTRLIGQNNQIPWRLKADLRWFQQLTLASAPASSASSQSPSPNILIMGRRTWESLPKRPLPGRTHYVVSSTLSPSEAPGAHIVSSFTHALEHIRSQMLTPSPRCFVIGGERLYGEAIASLWCRRIYETVVQYESPSVSPDAAYFPEIPDLLYDSEPLGSVEEENNLRFQRFVHTRKRPVLWWIDKSCYERDWLEHCLASVPHYEVQPAKTLVPNAIIIANQLVSHRSALEQYESTQTPFHLIHLSDEYLDDDYTCYAFQQCKTVFRNYLSPVFLRNPKIYPFGIGYRDQFATQCQPLNHLKQTPRTYVWTFAGYLKKSDRTQICQLFHLFTPNRIHETGGFNIGLLSTPEYAKLLCASKFVLCPIGNCSLDTFRLYEACEAGAIPVTLYSNVNQPFIRFLQNYWAILFETHDLPFIVSHSWEENVQKVAFYLEHPDAYTALQQRCSVFWNRYKTNLQYLFHRTLWDKS